MVALKGHWTYIFTWILTAIFMDFALNRKYSRQYLRFVTQRKYWREYVQCPLRATLLERGTYAEKELSFKCADYWIPATWQRPNTNTYTRTHLSCIHSVNNPYSSVLYVHFNKIIFFNVENKTFVLAIERVYATWASVSSLYDMWTSFVLTICDRFINLESIVGIC